MDKLLATLGLMFFLFLVLATAVEVILEVFRGVLEKFGITWTKGKVTLEEALRLSREFAPGNGDLAARLQSVQAVASQVTARAKDEIARLEQIRAGIGAAGVDTTAVSTELGRLAGLVKEHLAASERNRVFILRAIAALVGCALVYWADFHVFRILAADETARSLLGSLKGLQGELVNVTVGGIAAAAGSSYWHDMLDKVRSAKAAAGALQRP